MAVYIDELKWAKWKYGWSCRLAADTSGELHAFARAIGMCNKWAVKHEPPYYNLTRKQRAKAIAQKAVMLYTMHMDKILGTGNYAMPKKRRSSKQITAA